MKNKVEVSKINIKIGDKEIGLSLAEARELQKVLDETLGKKETVYINPSPVIIERPHIRPYPYPYWSISWNDTAGVSSVTYSLTSGNANPPSDFEALPVS